MENSLQCHVCRKSFAQSPEPLSTSAPAIPSPTEQTGVRIWVLIIPGRIKPDSTREALYTWTSAQSAAEVVPAVYTIQDEVRSTASQMLTMRATRHGMRIHHSLHQRDTDVVVDASGAKRGRNARETFLLQEDAGNSRFRRESRHNWPIRFSFPLWLAKVRIPSPVPCPLPIFSCTSCCTYILTFGIPIGCSKNPFLISGVALATI
jgi:hypothetical protein